MDDMNDNAQSSKEVRIKTFLASVASSKPIVFCVDCGSTRLDQNFFYELRCYNCGNTTNWDGFKFSIARNGDIEDVEAAIESKEASTRFDDWQCLSYNVLQSFARTVMQVSPEGNQNALTEESYRELIEAWNECKSNIERLLKEIPKTST